MQESAIVVLISEDDLILAVNRGGSVLDWSPPTGVRDPRDKSMAHTASRVMAEKTGVFIYHPNLEAVFTEDTLGESPHSKSVYMPRDPSKIVWPVTLTSTPHSGGVDWVPASRLVMPTCQDRTTHRAFLSSMGML